ncbi:MAG: glutamine synthetase, partial [Clostridiaceae bacterium]|nr:glutamine synthetase [Clostridiaceae bacterium]
MTFLAKPMEGLAGSGEHHHMGVVLKLANGEKLNLFDGGENHFLSRWGYAALMGLLHNYEITAPFIVQSNDAFRRLKKGYEAPICIVASLGRTLEVPSRNRTVLVGLIRDLEDPFATRFELRSPNPHTNTYLAMATTLQSMLDGIKWAVSSDKNEDQLLAELCKGAGDEADYLEKDRMYRSEDDVFTAYNDEERDILFGQAPASVWENVQNFDRYPEKMPTLTAGGVFTPELI